MMMHDVDLTITDWFLRTIKIYSERSSFLVSKMAAMVKVTYDLDVYDQLTILRGQLKQFVKL